MQGMRRSPTAAKAMVSPYLSRHKHELLGSRVLIHTFHKPMRESITKAVPTTTLQERIILPIEAARLPG